ncbi:hypothetical protein VTI74DRAFT_11621 [Chaetomium olivicolor]
MIFCDSIFQLSGCSRAAILLLGQAGFDERSFDTSRGCRAEGADDISLGHLQTWISGIGPGTMLAVSRVLVDGYMQIARGVRIHEPPRHAPKSVERRSRAFTIPPSLGGLDGAPGMFARDSFATWTGTCTSCQNIELFAYRSHTSSRFPPYDYALQFYSGLSLLPFLLWSSSFLRIFISLLPFFPSVR